MLELDDLGDGVHVLRMQNDENRFNADSVAAIHDALDAFDALDGAKALVTTGAGKFYSNGLDLEWLMGDATEVPENFMAEVERIFGRILVNAAPTAAAINGHAFAAGAMVAAAHDYRVMRSDRGFYCIPEVDLGMPLTAGMTAVLQARIPAPALHRAVVTGVRWSAAEMVEAEMAEAAAEESDVLDAAVAWAASQAHHAGEVLGTMKRGLYPAAAEVLGV